MTEPTVTHDPFKRERHLRGLYSALTIAVIFSQELGAGSVCDRLLVELDVVRQELAHLDDEAQR